MTVVEMFWQSLGVGLGIGIVHTLILLVVMILARSNARNRETDTLELMRERNELDRQKIEAINNLAKAVLR